MSYSVIAYVFIFRRFLLNFEKRMWKNRPIRWRRTIGSRMNHGRRSFFGNQGIWNNRVSTPVSPVRVLQIQTVSGERRSELEKIRTVMSRLRCCGVPSIWDFCPEIDSWIFILSFREGLFRFRFCTAWFNLRVRKSLYSNREQLFLWLQVKIGRLEKLTGLTSLQT